MITKTRQPNVTVPLSGFRYIETVGRGRKVVCEIDLRSFKKMNVGGLLDRMVSEARQEYVSGKTFGYTSAKDVMAALSA